MFDDKQKPLMQKPVIQKHIFDLDIKLHLSHWPSLLRSNVGDRSPWTFALLLVAQRSNKHVQVINWPWWWNMIQCRLSITIINWPCWCSMIQCRWSFDLADRQCSCLYFFCYCSIESYRRNKIIKSIIITSCLETLSTYLQ